MISALLIAGLTLATPARAGTVVDFEDDFDSYGAVASFSGRGGWVSSVAGLDAWSVAAGAVGPKTDNWGGNWGAGGLTDNHLVQTSATWDDFTLDVDFRSNDDDAIGVVFRFQDRRNFYAAFFSRGCYPAASGQCLAYGTGGWLYRVQNGVATTLATTGSTYTIGSWHAMRVVADGSSLQVWLDLTRNGYSAGERLMTATDGTFADGEVGLYAYSVNASRFDDVVVSILDTDDDGVADRDDNCPLDSNPSQADQDSDGIGDVCDSDRDGDGVDASIDCDDTRASIGGPDRYYRDLDGDGFGDPGAPVDACSQPPATSTNAGDCDDTRALVNPDADELCGNGLDDDCSGAQDDDAVDTTTFYRDADGDGFGDASAPIAACSAPAGYVTDATDCDDTRAKVNPDADELCANGLDDDCSGAQDDGAVDTATWYADGDGDGYGDVDAPTEACAQPPGHVADATDCDDARAAVNPGADELCGNGLDDDCEGTVDGPDAFDARPWWPDGDGDGWGRDGAAVVIACTRPAGHVDRDGDCDDTRATVRPGAPEQCNGVDDDCDGDIDEGVVDTNWWPDGDGDGFGDDSVAPVVDCVAPAGHSDLGGDCDDARADVHPSATEVCNGRDDDCDGAVDEDGGCDTDTGGDTGGDTDTPLPSARTWAASTDTGGEVVLPGSGCSCGGGRGGAPWGLVGLSGLLLLRRRRG